MAATRCNYIVIYENSPQVYSASTLETVIGTATPKNSTLEERTVLFTTYFPDSQELRVFTVPQDEIDEEQKRIEEKLRLRDEKRRIREQKKREEDGEAVPLS